MTDSKTDERGALLVTASSEDPRFNQPYSHEPLSAGGPIVGSFRLSTVPQALARTVRHIGVVRRVEVSPPTRTLNSTNVTTGSGGSTTPTTAATTGSASSSVSKSDVDNAKTVAIIGVIVGALGLIAGVVAIVLSRRRSRTT